MRKDLAIYLVHKTIGLGLSDDRSIRIIIFLSDLSKKKKGERKKKDTNISRTIIISCQWLTVLTGSTFK